MSLDLPQGGFIDTSGGPYLTFKGPKNMCIFVGHRPPGPLAPKFLAKFKRPHIQYTINYGSLEAEDFLPWCIVIRHPDRARDPCPVVSYMLIR